VDRSRLAELLRHRRRATVGGTVLQRIRRRGRVFSEGFRRRVFGNGLGIGEAIKVNGVPATVIGVAADGFNGLQFDGTSDIIVPFAVMRPAGGDPSKPFRSTNVVGRLARGVSIDAARAELLARWPSDSVGDAAGHVA